MVALKTGEIDAFVARPDPRRPIALVFGPDAGLVRERVDALVKAAVDDPADPFGLARLDGDALADEPSRLVEEAHTFPLFGGRRAVWVKAGGRNFTAAVEALLAAPPAADCRVVIEAGDLKRNAPLRAMCEKSAVAAALPCYADGDREITRLIDEEMRGVGTDRPGRRRVRGPRPGCGNTFRQGARRRQPSKRHHRRGVAPGRAASPRLSRNGVGDVDQGRCPGPELQAREARTRGPVDMERRATRENDGAVRRGLARGAAAAGARRGGGTTRPDGGGRDDAKTGLVAAISLAPVAAQNSQLFAHPIRRFGAPLPGHHTRWSTPRVRRHNHYGIC